jgi:hypothetical protein
MPRHIPARSVFFTVVVGVPGELSWCEETFSSFDEWMGAMAWSERASGLGAMPAIRVIPLELDGLGELVLEWVRIPAEGAWAAVESVVEDIAKVAFPGLLAKSLNLRVAVTCEQAVGEDIVLPD